jgi:hypothetical protein
MDSQSAVRFPASEFKVSLITIMSRTALEPTWPFIEASSGFLPRVKRTGQDAAAVDDVHLRSSSFVVRNVWSFTSLHSVRL